MAVENEVFEALINAGKQLKPDLWSPGDIAMLEQRAKDLVGLEVKAETATDPDKKSQYRLAASLIVDQVKMTALARLLVAQKEVLEALERLFLQVLVKYLLPLLPQLL